MAALTLVLVGGCGDAEIAPPKPEQTSTARSNQAQPTLARLAAALRTGDTDAARELAAPNAQDELAGIAHNARALDLRQLSIRYVDDSEVPSERAADYSDQAWVAEVQLSYQLPRWDPGPTRLETGIVLEPTKNGTLVAEFGGGSGRVPVWLSGALAVRSAGRVLAMAPTAGEARTLLTRGSRAVRDVDAVLPDWQGRLVLAEPKSTPALEAALDAEPGRYDAIAAVTSSVDGALVKGAPVHVWINPEVYQRLGQRGGQVVISHEATHVATGATFSGMPKWLSEGFADYVALLHAGVPLNEAAGQILDRVQKKGPPRHLPSPSDLDPRASGLGATYEEAWLACRFIAQRYGQEQLVAFYRAVDGGTPLEQAFRSVLGTSQKAFLSAWSSDVAALAEER